jgi:hypothetical protein
VTVPQSNTVHLTCPASVDGRPRLQSHEGAPAAVVPQVHPASHAAATPLPLLQLPGAKPVKPSSLQSKPELPWSSLVPDAFAGTQQLSSAPVQLAPSTTGTVPDAHAGDGFVEEPFAQVPPKSAQVVGFAVGSAVPPPSGVPVTVDDPHATTLQAMSSAPIKVGPLTCPRRNRACTCIGGA